MNLTEFECPMFSTTDREKEILRMCEMELMRLTYWTGLCNVLFRLNDTNRITRTEYLTLKQKISWAIAPKVYLEDGLELPWPTHKIRMLLRRIWITKLLNYKGDQP